jgi:hypothetical protein
MDNTSSIDLQRTGCRQGQNSSSSSSKIMQMVDSLGHVFVLVKKVTEGEYVILNLSSLFQRSAASTTDKLRLQIFHEFGYQKAPWSN